MTFTPSFGDTFTVQSHPYANGTATKVVGTYVEGDDDTLDHWHMVCNGCDLRMTKTLETIARQDAVDHLAWHHTSGR